MSDLCTRIDGDNKAPNEPMDDAFVKSQQLGVLEAAREMDIEPNYGVFFIALDSVIIHSIFYESYPSIADIVHNIEEVKHDPEFGHGDDAVNECKLVIIKIDEGFI